MKIQERIKTGEQTKAPQGTHRVGAAGAGATDRRTRREEWAKDDDARAAGGQPPRGVLSFPVVQDSSKDAEDG
jgi:hypothetical protein